MFQKRIFGLFASEFASSHYAEEIQEGSTVDGGTVQEQSPSVGFDGEDQFASGGIRGVVFRSHEDVWDGEVTLIFDLIPPSHDELIAVFEELELFAVTAQEQADQRVLESSQFWESRMHCGGEHLFVA